MNRKGFTLVELLAVLVLLGVLATIALTSVTKYRVLVRENEAQQLHSEIESSFDNLRLKGKVSETAKVNFCNGNTTLMNLAFDGKRLKCAESEGDSQIDDSFSYLILKNKGDLLNEQAYEDYINDPNNFTDWNAKVAQMVKDGVCQITQEEIRTEDAAGKTVSSVQSTCELKDPTKDKTFSNIKPSTNNILCVKLKTTKDVTIINDFDANNTKNESLCKYFGNE